MIFKLFLNLGIFVKIQYKFQMYNIVIHSF